MSVTHIINTENQPVPVNIVGSGDNLLLQMNEVLQGASDWTYSALGQSSGFNTVQVTINYPVMCLIKFQWKLGDNWVDGDTYQVSGSFSELVSVNSNEFRVAILVWSGTYHLEKEFTMEVRGVNNG